MIQNFYTTKDGRIIVVTDETREHMKAHPEVENILEEVLLNVELPQDKSVYGKEIDMGRVVGKSACVKLKKISLSEKSCFALRINREKASHVILDTEGDSTSKVIVWARFDENFNQYILRTAYIGNLAPAEPWDKSLKTETQKQESLDFWCEHALLYQKDVMGEPFESTWEEILKI